MQKSTCGLQPRDCNPVAMEDAYIEAITTKSPPSCVPGALRSLGNPILIPCNLSPTRRGSRSAIQAGSNLFSCSNFVVNWPARPAPHTTSGLPDSNFIKFAKKDFRASLGVTLRRIKAGLIFSKTPASGIPSKIRKHCQSHIPRIMPIQTLA